MSTVALTLITNAFTRLNVFQPGALIPPSQANQALRLLNNMLGQWAQMAWATSPVVVREVVTTVANKGGPSLPYSWGPGGDVTSPRPSNVQSLTGAAWILLTATPHVDVPLAIYTDDAYQAVATKELTNSQPTGIYYQATSPRGTLQLWPVPTVAGALALYRQQPLGPFPDLATTSVSFPDGYDEAIDYNLTRRLASLSGRTMLPEDLLIARESLLTIQRSNLKLSDLGNDFAGVWDGTAGGYNIQTGA